MSELVIFASNYSNFDYKGGFQGLKGRLSKSGSG